MRARSFALRDGFADVLKGLQVREEVRDYHAVTGSNVDAPDISAKVITEQANGALPAPEPAPEEALEVVNVEHEEVAVEPEVDETPEDSAEVAPEAEAAPEAREWPPVLVIDDEENADWPAIAEVVLGAIADASTLDELNEFWNGNQGPLAKMMFKDSDAFHPVNEAKMQREHELGTEITDQGGEPVNQLG